MTEPPVAIVAKTISQYMGEYNNGTRKFNQGELAHKILEALDLDHTLPVTPNRHLAPWSAA